MKFKETLKEIIKTIKSNNVIVNLAIQTLGLLRKW